MGFLNRLFRETKKHKMGEIRPGLEKLEERSVPATAFLMGSDLIVTGTDGPDRIFIQLDQALNQIVVRDGNREAGRFDSSSVAGIFLDGGKGNDALVVSSLISQAATINGNDGGDRIYAGSGPSMLLGGEGANRIAGGSANDILIGGGGYNVLGSSGGNNTLTGGPGANRFFGFADRDIITNFNPARDVNYFNAQTPPDLTSTLGLPPSPNITITAEEVGILLRRAVAATASNDGIAVIVDRSGRILGVAVENGVNPALLADANLATFAIDGAVAKARTGGLFGNNQAPLTSRTIQYISQSTLSEREVNSYPFITDENSTLRGPGYVGPVGIGNHFPPNIPFTPQVDLFQIEQTNRDSTYHPGPDRIKGTTDDILLPQRFNFNPAFIPASIPVQQYLVAPDSYGFVSGMAPNAQSRGIGTLPGGIPIVKNGVIVGGIGIFYPGATGFATEENSSLSTTYNPNLLDRSFEAEYVAYASLGGTAGFPVGEINGVPLPTGFALPSGRIDLVGITLPIFGPPAANGTQSLVAFGQMLGVGDPNAFSFAPLLQPNGNNQIVYTGTPATPGFTPVNPLAATPLLNGTFVPEGYLVTPHAGTTLSAAQVNQMLVQGVQQSIQTRSAIRLPLNQFAKMTIGVTDEVTGEVLGLFRMPDGTYFSIDVAVTKARNLAYYNSAQLQPVDQVAGLPQGVGFTNRTVRFLALPRFPEGIDGSPPGPFSQLNDGGINPTNARYLGAPLPASAYQSVDGFSSFHPQSNFRQVGNIANQSGIIYFSGSSGVYVNQILVGGVGISGDGVDQDDVVTFMAQQGFNTPESLRSDMYFVRGVRLPFQKFNRQPILPPPA